MLEDVYHSIITHLLDGRILGEREDARIGRTLLEILGELLVHHFLISF
jgi:hypothetical protein